MNVNKFIVRVGTFFETEFRPVSLNVTEMQPVRNQFHS